MPIAIIVASSDHRQAISGGKNEQRTDRTPVGHSVASGGRIGRSYLSAPKTFRDVVPQWWRRYVAEGPDGLFDLSRAPQAVVDRIPPQIERTIVSIRRRLEAHATSETRYQRVGALTIQAELKALQVTPLPGAADDRACFAPTRLTSPRMRMAPPINPNGYPGTPPRTTRIACTKSTCGAGVLERSAPTVVHLRLQRRFRWRSTPEIGPFATNGRGTRVSDRGLAAPRLTGPSAVRQRTRVLRLGQISTVSVARDSLVSLPARHAHLHPQRRPQRNGAVETSTAGFNLCCSDDTSSIRRVLRRELATTDDDGHEQHIQSRLGQRTVTCYRRGKHLRGCRQVQSRHRPFAYFRRPRHFHSPSVRPRQRSLSWDKHSGSASRTSSTTSRSFWVLGGNA